MGFPDLQANRGRSSLVDHLVIITDFVLTLLAFHVSDDPNTGKGSVSDGIGFSLAFLAVAYYVGWLPSLWKMSRRKWFEPLITPVFIVFALSYLYLAFRAFYIQPGATVTTFLIQAFSLIFLSFWV